MELPWIVGAAVALVLLGAWWLSRRLGNPGQPTLKEPKRLARLLASELALYSQDALESIEKGRSDPESLAELQQEIRRSREMFEERMGAEHLPAFDEAILEILAKGDSKLYSEFDSHDSAREA